MSRKRTLIAIVAISLVVLLSACSKLGKQLTPDPKTYYVEPTATTPVIDSQHWLEVAEDMRVITGNVSIYRVGDKWGIVTSTGTVTYEPIFTDVFICSCNQAKNVGGSGSTIVAIPDGLDNEWIISDQTGEMLSFHHKHNDMIKQPTAAYTSVIVCYESNGLWGFRYIDAGDVLVQAQYLQVTDPLLWDHQKYAWGQTESGWEVVLIP